MPWKETRVVEQKMAFVEAYLNEDDDRSMAELCRTFAISRRIGYQTLERYFEAGVEGLMPRPRAPHHHPNATNPEIVEVLVQAREDHPRWGPRKLIAWLKRKRPTLELPAPSTVGEILKRQGVVTPRKLRRRTPPSEQPFEPALEPNDLWCGDHKGWFRTGDGRRCDPLTLTDGSTRYLLRCDALSRPNLVQTRPCFERAFREYGLPKAIRTDNGTPFASTGVGGLTKLSAWWVTLGIRLERIEPGKPQQNGRHERMHLTLKQETASPPEPDLRAQQVCFARFMIEYNFERPHEALNNMVPGDLYTVSPRSYPRRAPELEYPSHFTIRKVRTEGTFRWGGECIYLSEALVGYPVGFEPLSERLWQLYFGPVALTRFDSHTLELIRPQTRRRRRPSRAAGSKSQGRAARNSRKKG